jgi:hypothetical protein
MFNQQLFPNVKRIFAQTIGLDLVSVQPLSAPKLSLNYMDFQYGTLDKRHRRKQSIDKIFKINENIKEI